MKYNGIAKVQHYVPQFILRNFGSKKKRRVHVFDKKNGNQFVTNARNVACESRFYDFNFQGFTLTLEPSLSKIEDMAKGLFIRILDEDSLLVLSSDERAQLCIFFSIQFTRTRWFYEHFLSIPKILDKKLRQSGENDEFLKGIEHYLRNPSDNEAKMQFTKMISEAPQNYAVHFANKTWVFIKTDRKYPFVIGDNPLALHNTIDMKPYGNIGLAVRGIEIYFPLSPTRALALWCPSHEEMFRQTLSMPTQLHPLDLSLIEETVIAIQNGQPLMYRPDNVLNFNSLQILHAERYVFSNIGEFSLCRMMIAKDDRIRCGPRMHID